MAKRKRFTASQKAHIALEILKEEKTINQIASEYGIHPNVLYRWKKQAIENLPKLFDTENKGERERQAEHERQMDELYNGYIKALGDNGIQYRPEHVLDGSGFVRGASWYENIRNKVKKMTSLPQAFVTISEQPTQGVIDGLREKGKTVPHDVAIAAFLEEQPDEYKESEVTSVYHPVIKKGESAIRMLEAIMEGKLKRDKIHQKTVEPYLVVRGSSKKN